MWLQQFKAEVNLRHTCEQGDRLPSYGWLMHDGINFGVQEVTENDFTLTTEFVKRHGGRHGGDWTWRITAKPQVCCCHHQSALKRCIEKLHACVFFEHVFPSDIEALHLFRSQ